jgi:hypothetical protein
MGPYVGQTSVYLSDDEAEGLRRLSVREGRPQAELIREGVRKVIAENEARPRTFRSLGSGRSGGKRPPTWTSEELYRKAVDRR